MEPIVIARRFRGPATSGNGGYVAGARTLIDFLALRFRNKFA